MMMYVQLKHTHIASYVCSLEKSRIPALMGNIVNNQFLINTWEIIFLQMNAFAGMPASCQCSFGWLSVSAVISFSSFYKWNGQIDLITIPFWRSDKRLK